MSMVDDGIIEFVDTFLRRGWRGIEKNYGSCSAVLLKLIARAGGDALLAERAARNVSCNTGRTGRRSARLLERVDG